MTVEAPRVSVPTVAIAAEAARVDREAHLLRASIETPAGAGWPGLEVPEVRWAGRRARGGGYVLACGGPGSVIVGSAA